MHTIKKLIFSAMLFSGLSVSLAAQAAAIPVPASSVQNLDEIVATVNNSIITQSEVDQEYHRLEKRYHAAGKTLPSNSQVKTAVLNHLIDQTLQLQIAKKFNITASSQEIQQALQRLAKQNQMSVAQFKKKSNREGYTNKELMEQISQQIKISKIQGEAVSKNVNVTPAEVDQLLSNYNSQVSSQKKYHVIDVHIPFPNNPTKKEIQKLKFRALYIAQQLKQGKSYKQTGVNPNDLGWQSESDLPNLFVDQLDKMHKDGLSKPIQAPNGFHILKLIGIKNSGAKQMTRKQAQQMIFQQKFVKAVEKWLETLRKSAYIKILKSQ